MTGAHRCLGDDSWSLNRRKVAEGTGRECKTEESGTIDCCNCRKKAVSWSDLSGGGRLERSAEPPGVDLAGTEPKPIIKRIPPRVPPRPDFQALARTLGSEKNGAVSRIELFRKDLSGLVPGRCSKPSDPPNSIRIRLFDCRPFLGLRPPLPFSGDLKL